MMSIFPNIKIFKDQFKIQFERDREYSLKINPIL
jgi:hypothetical protein